MRDDTLFFRAEDIRGTSILSYFVEGPTDRRSIDSLKKSSPVILRGSRGVGKSFLLRAAEAEMRRDFDQDRTLPVYLSFNKAGLIRAPSGSKFLEWMTAKICTRIIRAASSSGLHLPAGSAIEGIGGQSGGIASKGASSLVRLEESLENSWRSSSPATHGDLEIPAPDELQEAVEDLCEASDLSRVILLVDEAAHVFLPEQQRQFFTLMRDLRSPYIAVKAAVYPGATSYGDTFQPTHDATVIDVDRPVSDETYTMVMRDIVIRQQPDLAKLIARRGGNFDGLACAATGNPRTLLKTFDRARDLTTTSIENVFRTYYRDEIWGEHSKLADKYLGHKSLIDWGRNFLQDDVLPSINERNRGFSAFLWIHRDSPEPVKEALRLLSYSGLLSEGEVGVRGTRNQPGTRYMVNLGCLMALTSNPVEYGLELRGSLSVRRMTEYGMRSRSYARIADYSLSEIESTAGQALDLRLQASISNLDLTKFQMSKLRELNFVTIGEVLAADKTELKKARYVGDIRAQQIANAAYNAVLEYLSG